MKIAIICPNFKESNINRLPWKYIYHLATYLNQEYETVIITDSNSSIQNLRIINVEKLFHPLKGETKELLDILESENPDKCIMLTGLTSFLRREFKIQQPTIGIFTSPIYTLKELIRNIGIKDSIKYRNYIFIHFLNALIPNYFVKKWEKSFEKMIFLTEYTERKLIEKGFPQKKAVIIKCGIDETFNNRADPEKVKKLREKINPNNIPLIMYLTSPLTLRGTDTLLKAFIKLRETKKCRLVFLSRMDSEELQKEVNILENIAKKNNVTKYVDIISEKLDLEEVKCYVSAADIICLPFKIVISDFPVSIIESPLLGKVVISTDVAGISEFIEQDKLSRPNNIEDLAKVLIRHLDKNLKRNNSNYKFISWKETSKAITKLID